VTERARNKGRVTFFPYRSGTQGGRVRKSAEESKAGEGWGNHRHGNQQFPTRSNPHPTSSPPHRRSSRLQEDKGRDRVRRPVSVRIGARRQRDGESVVSEKVVGSFPTPRHPPAQTTARDSVPAWNLPLGELPVGVLSSIAVAVLPLLT